MGNADVEESLTERPLLNARILKQNFRIIQKALKLLLQFKPVLIEEVAEIESGLARNDPESVRFRVHRIRSASLYLGIEGIGFPATRQEELIECGAPMDEIMAAWGVTTTSLPALFGS